MFKFRFLFLIAILVAGTSTPARAAAGLDYVCPSANLLTDDLNVGLISRSYGFCRISFAVKLMNCTRKNFSTMFIKFQGLSSEGFEVISSSASPSYSASYSQQLVTESTMVKCVELGMVQSWRAQVTYFR